MGKNFKLTAKTLFGFEDLLATELKNLGALNIQKGQRMVSFEGDDGFMYKANQFLEFLRTLVVSVEDHCFGLVLVVETGADDWFFSRSAGAVISSVSSTSW